MKRSPWPFKSLPPAPRSPSSRRAPVISEFGTTRPVGWNCTISMSLTGAPARRASAMPSAALSAEQAITRYMVGPPPMARRVARLRTAVKPPRRMSSTSAPPTRPAPRPDLLGEPVHDLDAGQIALVNGAVVGLPRERLLVDASLRIAIEEAAV